MHQNWECLLQFFADPKSCFSHPMFLSSFFLASTMVACKSISPLWSLFAATSWLVSACFELWNFCKMCSANIALVSSHFVKSSIFTTNSLSFLSPVLLSSFAAGLVPKACAAIAVYVAVPFIRLLRGYVDAFFCVFLRSFLVFFMYVAALFRFCWRKFHIVEG